MASSDYYYDKYQDKKAEASRYKNDIKDLQKVLENLTDYMNDEVLAVNRKLDALKKDLDKSIRYNVTYTMTANDIGNGKEPDVSADGHLSIAIRELEEEIARLTRLKDNAQAASDEYYDDYKDAKERERRARQLEREREKAEKESKKNNS